MSVTQKVGECEWDVVEVAVCGDGCAFLSKVWALDEYVCDSERHVTVCALWCGCVVEDVFVCGICMSYSETCDGSLIWSAVEVSGVPVFNDWVDAL